MLEFIKEHSTVILIVIGIIILAGVLFVRSRLNAASESFKNGATAASSYQSLRNEDVQSEIQCDEVSGICQRVPKNGEGDGTDGSDAGLDEDKMLEVQKKMDVELLEEQN
jgi:FtsZ-interacting cell division protein ZipA